VSKKSHSRFPSSPMMATAVSSSLSSTDYDTSNESDLLCSSLKDPFERQFIIIDHLPPMRQTQGNADFLSKLGGNGESTKSLIFIDDLESMREADYDDEREKALSLNRYGACVSYCFPNAKGLKKMHGIIAMSLSQ